MTIRGGFMTRMQGQEERFRFSELDRQALRMLWGYMRVHKSRLALALAATLPPPGAAPSATESPPACDGSGAALDTSVEAPTVLDGLSWSAMPRSIIRKRTSMYVGERLNSSSIFF